MRPSENERVIDEALAKAETVLAGLCCHSCKAQGMELAAPGRCSRDVDCDAGWYGIQCDEVAETLALLKAARERRCAPIA